MKIIKPYFNIYILQDQNLGRFNKNAANFPAIPHFATGRGLRRSRYNRRCVNWRNRFPKEKNLRFKQIHRHPKMYFLQ